MQHYGLIWCEFLIQEPNKFSKIQVISSSSFCKTGPLIFQDSKRQAGRFTRSGDFHLSVTKKCSFIFFGGFMKWTIRIIPSFNSWKINHCVGIQEWELSDIDVYYVVWAEWVPSIIATGYWKWMVYLTCVPVWRDIFTPLYCHPWVKTSHDIFNLGWKNHNMKWTILIIPSFDSWKINLSVTKKCSFIFFGGFMKWTIRIIPSFNSWKINHCVGIQ